MLEISYICFTNTIQVTISKTVLEKDKPEYRET